MLFNVDELAINKRTKQKIKGTPRSLSSLKPPVYEEVPYVEFTTLELVAAAQTGTTLAFDIETYRNYFLIAFKCIETGRCVILEDTPDGCFDRNRLDFVITHFRIISFNGIKYDVPMMTAARAGFNCHALKILSDKLVDAEDTGERYGPREFEEEYMMRCVKFNHIDVIEVAPLKASLKLYAGRLHCKRMQDLPFPPDAMLDRPMARAIRFYCVNDLDNTILMFRDLEKQIDLRVQLSREYGQDLRSRSDAQIAEHVISAECAKINGFKAKRPEIAPGTVYHYKVPDFVFFQTKPLQDMLMQLRSAPFIISEKGRPKCDYLHGLTIRIGQSVYRMGVGGLHSSESCIAHRAENGFLLVDRDVASFYPYIILNLGLFPSHLGPAFLTVYRSLVERRIQAKGKAKDADLSIAELNQIIADSIKITINGSFGKLGSKYSNLYSPDLLIQVTLTGQLALLMLIEALEMEGIAVVSGNTDGIVIKPHFTQYNRLNEIVKMWEQHTKFTTEETQYRAIFNRDVNNYVALKKHFDKETNQWVNVFPDGTKLDKRVKGKGVFAEADIWKNPSNGICVDALLRFLDSGEDISAHIEQSVDTTKFVTVRTVKGGAYYVDTYVGKAVRFYYAKGSENTLNYMLTGNKVPKSEGCKPLMTLPDSVPDDLDRDWYINETQALLRDIGYYGHHQAREVEQAELFDLAA